MVKILKLIKSKYILQNIYEFVPFNKSIKIVKYNKYNIQRLDYSVDSIKIYLFFSKIIKPISNCEDYLPIITRIISSKHKLSYNDITNLFCNYLNKNNNKFIPQINKIKGNICLLDNLNYFKIGFNEQFLDYFINYYKEDKLLYFKKLSEFCKKYGKKIKEITFMDKYIQKKEDILLYYFTMKYILNNSEIKKIYDRFYNCTVLSIFTDIYNFDYDYLLDKEEYFNYISRVKKDKYIFDIIKELKKYSLYLEHINKAKNNYLISSLCADILKNGKNLEEFEITKINKENESLFIRSIKNLGYLKSLIISCPTEGKQFYDRLSKRIKTDSLTKLEININYFEEAYKIIDKNKNSLKELTLKINCINKVNDGIIKRLSVMPNLQKIRLIAEFPIVDEDNLQYLSLKKVAYLEIPLYIKNNIFELNLFFEKIPNLKKLIFNGINFEDIKEENILNKLKDDSLHPNNIKKIHFLNSQKNSSFFIIKLLEIFSKNNIIKDKIKEIKIENCDFGKNISLNNLLKLISSFTYIKSLSVSNNIFEERIEIFYYEINNFEYLQKLYLKGINFQKSDIKICYFLYKFLEKLIRLNELGFSCTGLNPYDLNLIIKVVKNHRLLIKLNIFDEYTEKDYYTNKEENFYLSGINVGELNDYCLFDLRNITLKKSLFCTDSKEYKDYKKNIITDYFQIKNKITSNKKEKYFYYENLFENNSFSNNLFYSIKKKSFILGNINK